MQWLGKDSEQDAKFFGDMGTLFRQRAWWRFWERTL